LADLTIDSNLGGTVGTKLSGSLGAVGPVSITGIPDSYSYRVKEIPSVRTHLPANYMIALSLLGFEVAAVRLCGEGQIITEPYRPGACETCGHGRAGVQVRSA
jgi:hypothetical protein